MGIALIAASANAQTASPSPAGAGAPGAAAASSGANAPATGGSATTAEAERVIVTGSNIPTAEEVGPNPVDTYRAEDIVKLGVTTTTDLQQKIPSIQGGQINENIANGGDGRVEINLRGLGPKETLILIDGRRLAPRLTGTSLGGQSVDINIIPFAAVDHVDILKDGASAIYGADAVAGVFNVYMKHKFRGLEIMGQYGNTNMGASNDASEKIAYVLAGAGDDKTDVVVFAEDYDRAAIFSRDRDVTSNAQKSKFGGIDLRSGNFAGRVGSFVFIPGAGGGTQFDGNSPTPAAFPNAANDPEYQARGTVPFNTNRRAFNFAALTPAIPAADRQYYYGSFVRDLCDKYLTVFADFRHTRTFFDAALAPTPFTPDPFVINTSGIPFSTAGISVPLRNPFNPFTVANGTLPAGSGPYAGTPVYTGVFYRSVEAGNRTDKRTFEDTLFNAGLRGQLGEFGDYFKTWGWETSFRYNRNLTSEETGNVVSKPGLREALFDSDPATAFNPFGLNLNTPAALNRVFVTLHHTSHNELLLEDLKFYGDLFNLPAGPVSFAIGSEHRKEEYNDVPDSLNVTFSTIGSTDLQGSRGDRDVWSIYGELRIPITSPSWNFPGLYSVELSAAERYEYFSKIAPHDSETPKISLRWQPFDSSLTLRGSYNEAFHAPFLNELSPSGAETFPQIIDPLNPDQGAFQTRSLVGGNPNLSPEKAYIYTYGVIWSPKWVKGLTLAADFWHYDERNVVSPFGTQDILNLNASIGAFPGQVIRDAAGNLVQVNNQTFNIGRQITEGYDFEAIYQLDTSIFGRGNFGTFTWTGNATYLSRFETNTPGSDKEFDLTGEYLTFGGLTHWRGYLSMFYDLGGLDTGATVHYIGQYNENQGFALTPTGNRKIREWTTLDLLASYTFNLPCPEQPVAGYAKDGGKNVKMKDGKDKNVMPVSTAECNPCGWRAWLNGVTLTVGMNNVFDQDPPFVASSFENGYDESAADVKGRFYYVSLKKRW
ncbi:MAG: TonB-dependent receptor plug domain-containing protein [Chthoniobacterales bacterium]